jgi:hypothetical protein
MKLDSFSPSKSRAVRAAQSRPHGRQRAEAATYDLRSENGHDFSLSATELQRLLESGSFNCETCGSKLSLEDGVLATNLVRTEKICRDCRQATRR